MIVKRLVSTRGERPPLRKYVGKKSMSVLIGIICPDAIILAADSQITDIPTGTFSYADKISVVDFWPGDEVLVAQAGLPPLTNRIVEKMREKAKRVKITNAGDVTKIVEDSIRDSKNQLDEKQLEYAEESPSELMLAFYVGKNPVICTVNVDRHGLAFSPSEHYATSGTGAYLAGYFLKEYAVPKSHSDLAIATSIFAINKVKDTTKYCGGDTTIKRLYPIPQNIDLDKQYIGHSQLIPKDFVNLAEQRIVKRDEKDKKSRNKRIYDVLKKTGLELGRKAFKKAMAEQKIEEEAEKQREKETEEMLKKFHSET